MAALTPAELRSLIRKGEHKGPTSGLCPGFLQQNLAILRKDIADDFKRFCELNNQPCPLLQVLPAGQVCPDKLAAGADVRTDLPKYRVYRNGDFVEEVHDITPLWDDSLVSFFLGCSFSFERALQNAGIPIRNIDEKKNVSMYKTNIQCTSVGIFNCCMVVSMRPIKKDKVQLAAEITSRFVSSHGAPVHIGDPAAIGIQDLSKVDFGDAVSIMEDEVPVFWACGVTAIMAAISSKSDLVITHSPGHMFVSDVSENDML